MNKTNKLVRKVSITETLRNMSVGETVTLSSAQVTTCVVRTTANRLKAAGFNFKVRERKGGTIVERI